MKLQYGKRVNYKELADLNVTDAAIVEPKSVKQALQSEEWCVAMKEELEALHNNKTWSLVIPPPNTNIVTCKWVFKVQKNSDGSFSWRKARLVARGFNQVEGVNFHETFSPVVKFTTVRLVLSFAVSNNWEMRQVDVNNAFLHRDLQEEVYMAQPPGFSHKVFPNHVYKLQRSLYGLRQSPHVWYEKL